MQRAKFVFILNASLSISFCLIVSYFWQIKQTRYEKICIRTMSIMPMALHIGLCIYFYKSSSLCAYSSTKFVMFLFLSVN